MNEPTMEMETIQHGSLQQVNALPPPLSVKDILDRKKLVQDVMKQVLKEGLDGHYGTIPGCGDKKVLFKSGAEALSMTFQLLPTFQIKQTDLPGGHREYQVICTLNGKVQGVGCASTMEGKWRFRTGPKESTGQPVPKDYWNFRKDNPAQAQMMLGGRGFAVAKEDGVWMIVRQGEKIENDNPADVYNTVLKMGKKRAFVDAVITATSTSDIFTQDLEEGIANDDGYVPREEKTVNETKPAAPKPTPKPQAKAPSPGPVAPSDGGNVIVGYIAAVTVKPMPKGGNKYGICITESPDQKRGGTWLNTFHETDGDKAESLKGTGIEVECKYTEGRFGKDLMHEGIRTENDIPEEPPVEAPTGIEDDVPF